MLNQQLFTLRGKSIQPQETNPSNNLIVGFLVSSDAKYDPLNFYSLKIPAVLQSNGEFITNYSPTHGGIFYFKAFAENHIGTTYGKTFKVRPQQISEPNDLNSQQKALYILKSDSLELSGGWLQNSWFGIYKDFENGWIYHIIHGWLYLASDSEGGIWAWSQDRGWTWSNKDIYPFIFIQNKGSWIYLLGHINNKPIFFDYSTNSIEK
jgi:hypothetical protein